MINLQFKNKQLENRFIRSIDIIKIMDEIEQKGLMMDQGNDNSCRLFVKCVKKYMHCRIEIRYILHKFKIKREK